MYICICIYVYMYIFIYVYMYICIYVCVYIYICKCKCICVCICTKQFQKRNKGTFLLKEWQISFLSFLATVNIHTHHDHNVLFLDQQEH